MAIMYALNSLLQRGFDMEQFIEMKQDAEFILALAVLLPVSFYIGHSFGEFQNDGGSLIDFCRNINYHRAKAIFWGIVK